MGNAYEDDRVRLGSVFSLNWVALDRPQRISTLLGLICGFIGATFGIFISAAFNPLFFVAFLPLAVPNAWLIESSLPSDVQRKERNSGILDAVSFVGATIVRNPVPVTNGVSAP